jgi:hypothetical protein
MKTTLYYAAAFGCALLLARPSGAVPTPAAHAGGVRATIAHPRLGMGMNPHIHGATTIAHPAQTRIEQRADHIARPTIGEHRFDRADHARTILVHHVWSNRWDYAAWRVTHLHYGEVSGVVLDASGAPARRVQVWLQKPGGVGFKLRARKHRTLTDAAGHFVMRHVLAQNYRLATHHGHVQLTVRAGTLASALVKFE